MARPSLKTRRPTAWDVALPAVVCLVLTWLVVAVNLSSILTSRGPDTAASLFYANAAARASIAQRTVLIGQTPAASRRALALAQDAVAIDPTVPNALSAAAFSFELLGQGARTRQVLLMAEQLTRRNLPVQIWLIEDSVRRGDVSGALHRYDVALRTSREASALLFPVLNAAIADRQMVRPIARLLAGDPAWRPDFTSQLVTDGPLAGTTNLAVMLAALHSPLPDEYASTLMLRLSRVRDYDRAAAVLRANFPETARAQVLLRDPTFVRPGSALPFGWQFVDGSDLGVAQVAGGRGGGQLYANSGASGEAARQLVMLPPGHYRLEASYADAEVPSGSAPRWQVVCGSEAAATLTEIQLLAGSGKRAAMASFVVPAQGCPAQWVFLMLPLATSDADLSVDLVSLKINRAR